MGPEIRPPLPHIIFLRVGSTGIPITSLIISCSSLPFVQGPAREIPSPFSAQLPWLERCECDYGAPLNVVINAKYRAKNCANNSESDKKHVGKILA
jgi:hypothetical protein